MFSSIPNAIKDIQRGKMLILLDNPGRENEADFYIPVDKMTPEILTTMIRMGGGLVCTAITQKQAHNLALPLMVDRLENTEKTGVNFTVSVNAKKGITTGVSVYDRVKTIQILGNPKSRPKDITKPGHVLGLVAQNGGVLKRAGHTEAAVDLARLTNLNPAGVLCEILSDNGKVANYSDLEKLSKELDLKIISIDDLIKYLKQNPLPPADEEPTVVKAAASTLPTKYGLFKISIYKSLIDNREHAVLTLGEIGKFTLTRIHSQCLTGDTYLSLRCDCGDQLQQSLKKISKNGNGILIYLNQEGRGIGLTNKIKAYQLQDSGLDTVEANKVLGFPSDLRDYKVAADILKDLGISDIKLLSNNPDKKNQLSRFGINVLKRVPLEVKPNKINLKYLKAKKSKLNHQLELV
ncbi:GTP cyclohydrolase II [Candidatus Daviesbacteria bacterium]|nr:GTP cyclohydrolase II [Candidatus Daviesbacteria bacterium]